MRNLYVPLNVVQNLYFPLHVEQNLYIILHAVQNLYSIGKVRKSQFHKRGKLALDDPDQFKDKERNVLQ